ncbi:related to MSH5-meiosis-specific protein [Serendipita indica DSM 11827]|uniref:Related to MSH5-meiosis-specific protein n=1 Tax=Serendipita indica (strain DSM 11827) TaxID=1109443 RepID=G4T8M2_SERID|nr:related to MSH5-meiosis-specific protein [Serendipita indica DSM 11827]
MASQSSRQRSALFEENLAEEENTRSIRSEDAEDATPNDVSEICLTIICTNGRLACAYFDPITGTLFIMEDTEENKYYDLAARILEQVCPGFVLTSSRSDELFIDFLRDQLNDHLQVRPWKEFTAKHGTERLQTLPLLAGQLAEEEEDSVSAQDNIDNFMSSRGTMHPSLIQWRASIRSGNFTVDEGRSQLCMSSIGALIDYLTRSKVANDAGWDVEELDDVKRIEYFSLAEYMQIHSDALLSLQVFLSEKHASIYSDSVKEGLSIYGILNQTRTPFGGALLRQWLLRPSTSLSTISERHDAISCLTAIENQATAAALHKNIVGTKGVLLALARLRKGKATLQNWKAVIQFWVSVTLVRGSLLELHHTLHIRGSQELLEMIGSSHFAEVAQAINDIIDWEESTNLGRIVVKPLVDEELDQWKETMATMDSFLSKVAQGIVATLAPEEATLFSEFNVVYFPQLGYLISVSGPTEQPLEPNDCPEGWVFQFMTNNTLYFKSDKMHGMKFSQANSHSFVKDLDECIGDVNTLIADREIEIIQSLQAEVLNYSDNIATMCERLAVLDCLLSLADAARRYQWIRPEMCEDVVLDIRDGRHPIQELVDENFVANDVYAVGGTPSSNHSESSSSSQEKTGNSIVICTGANASGKSIYLKQCALIPYLAQVGSFVPAASARLGIIHRIFTRIQTRESVSKMQSALMIELNQVSLAIRHGTTPRTIVLLDEFGKGTLSSDGAGLFTGVIKHFLSLGDMCPLVIAATHFHEIFDASMLSPDLPISFVHMSVMITNTSGSVLETDADNAAIPDKGEKREGDRLVRPGEAVTYLFK